MLLIVGSSDANIRNGLRSHITDHPRDHGSAIGSGSGSSGDEPPGPAIRIEHTDGYVLLESGGYLLLE